MRPDKQGEAAREGSPGLQVFAPGETVPEPPVPAATERRFERGNGPLDTPKPRPRRQVGRRIFEHGK
jgi:hypothetical protein